VADVLCPVVVGREDEIQSLQAALEAIGSSRGIGKSRLTRVALELAEKEGLLCAVGRAVADGFEIDLVPGDGHVVGPGHDAWVVGDEPCVTLDFIPSATA